MRFLGFILASLTIALPAAPGQAQQATDTGFAPSVAHPRFEADAGPRVRVDAGHHNFHTVDGRYAAFAAVLRADGYRVSGISAVFTPESLTGFDILVIANAGTDRDSPWALPTPSAFTSDEITAVSEWVRRGGSLFLIADHMPAAGATADLARVFGLRMTNGYTMQPQEAGIPGDRFSREAGTLRDHVITNGGAAGERVDSVVTFTGQGFQADADVDTLLVFGPEAYTLLPVEAGVGFDDTTPRVYSGGWLHGAARRMGEGRVVVFGEAAMFTAQTVGANALPIGMNSPRAPGNQQLLLNVMHWLSGGLD